MPIKAVALKFGYVESNTTSWLLYHAESTLPSNRKEALCSLAEYLYQKYEFERKEIEEHTNKYKTHMSKCCQKAYEPYIKVNPTHCPTCNSDYSEKYIQEFSVDAWNDFLFEIQKSNCNDYGEHYSIDNFYGWSPWMFDFNTLQHEIVIVCENTSTILLLALCEKHPELVDILEEFNNDSENYLFKDYKSICDETNTFIESGYGKLEVQDELIMTSEGVAKLQKPQKIIAETIYRYPNGAIAKVIDGQLTYIKYNTGDKVWFENNQVVSFLTHDDIAFGEPASSKLAFYMNGSV